MSSIFLVMWWVKIFLFWLMLNAWLLYLLRRFYLSRKEEIASMPDEAQEKTPEAIMNAKVPAEKDYVAVNFGKDIIQMSPAEFVIFNSYDRKGKREFVRKLKKLVKATKAESPA